jgi:hypothetical protein
VSHSGGLKPAYPVRTVLCKAGDALRLEFEATVRARQDYEESLRGPVRTHENLKEIKHLEEKNNTARLALLEHRRHCLRCSNPHWVL